MAIDVTPVFAAYLAQNRGPVPGDPDASQTPDYDVSATLDGGVLELVLTFRGGAAYCCSELGCHLGLHEGKRWERLRRELVARGASVPAQLELRLNVAVESGALFFDLSRPEPSRRGRGWYAFAPAEARRYDVVVAEAPATAAE